MFEVQHSSKFEDLQIFVANVLYSGNDPQVGRGWDITGGSRERDLKATSGANGLGVSTDGCKTKSKKRQRKHGEAKESKGSWIGARCFSALNFVPFGTPDSAAEVQAYSKERKDPV